MDWWKQNSWLFLGMKMCTFEKEEKKKMMKSAYVPMTTRYRDKYV
jgi:hypothetical protein